MDSYTFILILISVFVVSGTIIVLFANIGGYQRKLAKKTVIVHSQNNESIRGVLVNEHSDRISLSQAVYLHGDSQETPIDGIAHVPKANVAWIQEVPVSKPNVNPSLAPVNR